MQQQSNL
jgi:hypothetical protein